jgi:sortase A
MSADLIEAPPEKPPVAPPARPVIRVPRRLRSHRPRLAPRQPFTAAGRIAAWVALAVSVVAVWTVVYALVLSSLQQHRSNAVLYDDLRENLSAATTPIGGVIRPGTPIALINVPELGLRNSVVVEGTSADELKLGPGHRRDTPLPGQPGVSVIFGRSVTYGAPFAQASKLKAGDQITVTTGQGKFSYRVSDVRGAGDPLPPRLPVGGSRVILESSVTAGWQQGFTPARTVYVDATLVGKTQPAPSGRLGSIPKSEREMRGDPSVLIALVFWLQALVLVAVALVWGRERWGAWQSWIVGVPLLTAVAWGTSSTALALLPNLV